MGVQLGPGLPSHPLRTTTRPLLRQHYAPSVFEKYTARVTVGSKEVTLNLYDTAGECACAAGVLGSAGRVSLTGIPRGTSPPSSLSGALTSCHSWRPRRGAGWEPVDHRLAGWCWRPSIWRR